MLLFYVRMVHKNMSTSIFHQFVLIRVFVVYLQAKRWYAGFTDKKRDKQEFVKTVKYITLQCQTEFF